MSNEDFSTKNYLFYARKSLPLLSNFLAHKRYFLESEILIERQQDSKDLNPRPLTNAPKPLNSNNAPPIFF